MGHRRPRERQPQPPEAWKDPLGARELASAAIVAHLTAMIPARPVNPLSLLSPAEPGVRFRPGLPPSPERIRELREAVRAGTYRVSPELVAGALIAGR